MKFDLKTQRKVAVKIINLSNTKKQSIDSLQREIIIMNSLNEQNGFISLFDVEFDDVGNFYLIMELAQGNLMDLMLSKKEFNRK